MGSPSSFSDPLDIDAARSQSETDTTEEDVHGAASQPGSLLQEQHCVRVAEASSQKQLP